MTGQRIVVRTKTPEETRAVGRAIGRSLGRSFILSLDGPLGSGKTVLAAGVCAALGVDGPVTSPTYTLQNEYEGRGGRRVIHMDFFRLSGPGEFDDLGLEDRMDEDTVVLVEWGERVRSALPDDAIRVELIPGDGDVRQIAVRLPEGVSFDGLTPTEETS